MPIHNLNSEAHKKGKYHRAMRTSRNFIPVAVIAALTVLAGVVAPSANAATNPRYITVSSEGTVKVTPDAVRLNATVSVVAASNKEALAQASTKSAAVRAALTTAGVAKADIATQSITTYPEYNYTQDKGQVLIGYRASQSFNVVLRKTATAGDVVDAVVAAGGDSLQVNGVTPFILDSSKATAAARATAVKNAKAKALSYASLLGVKLGKVNYLSENSSPSITPIAYSAMAKSDAGATVVDLGQQDVTVSITVQWAL